VTGARRVRRRAVVRASGLAAASLAAGCGVLERASGCGSASGLTGPAASQPGTSASPAAVTRAPALRADPQGILDLPEGFSYRVLQRGGEMMTDGYRVPGRPDAMACFAGPNGALLLMRNHELVPGQHALGPCADGQPPPPEAYDPRAPGGVSRLVLDHETLALRSSNLVLAGTYWNCAGGVSPWGFLSCEETVDAGHGYVFSCPTDAGRVAPARRITAYGRFRHEAAAVHGATLTAYLTEDEWDGALYRFVPSSPSDPWQGRLQALRIRDAPRADTGLLGTDAALRVDWVDIDDPEAVHDDVRDQAHAKGAAFVRRGEGLWIAGDDVYVCATTGGKLERGQVLRLHLGDPDTLYVLAASEDPDVLDMPDAVCVAPNGNVFVAEDGYGGNYLRRIDAQGRVTPFARNALSRGELAGVCFAPDGRTMFVNLQNEHLTLAVRGPFDTLASAEDSRGPKPAPFGFGSAFAALALAVLTRGQTLGR
jgi:secreted PhoX family phosphatase